MAIAAFWARNAELVRAWEHLAQGDLRTTGDFVDQSIDALRGPEIDRQNVVAINQSDVPRKTSGLSPVVYLAKLFYVVAARKAPDLLFSDVPSAPRQNETPVSHPR